jgi:peptidoglycan hydrolase CwlO-like protein
MQAVKAGLAGIGDRTTGIAGIARDDKQKQAIKLLSDAVVKIRDLSEDTKLKSVDKFVAELKTHTTSLEKIVKQVAAANPAAAVNADDQADEAADAPAMPKAGGAKKAAAPKGAAAPAAPGAAAPAAAPPAAAPPAAPAGKG